MAEQSLFTVMALPSEVNGRILTTNRREEQSMARIKHIALTTKDPAGVASFYKEAFGLREIRRAPNGAARRAGQTE